MSELLNIGAQSTEPIPKVTSTSLKTPKAKRNNEVMTCGIAFVLLASDISYWPIMKLFSSFVKSLKPIRALLVYISIIN